ncbi:hypothetical protein [Gordonia humi]|uniref:Uncharacterized protein n=1 Tax=Gordonia humi TaxID=686429 RepID=A0A840F0C9_9ACTN|nr:hypothetical protein [Gordonia humi]MBB4136074.1 hypothetical protein [Gordonia humi]
MTAEVTGEQLREHYVGWAQDEGVTLDPSDLALIDRLVTATDFARDLEHKLATVGAVLLTAHGTEKANPLLAASRSQAELTAKLVTVLDRRIGDAAADDVPNRGGVQPFATRGPYAPSKTGTDDEPVATSRRPARTPRKRAR